MKQWFVTENDTLRAVQSRRDLAEKFMDDNRVLWGPMDISEFMRRWKPTATAGERMAARV